MRKTILYIASSLDGYIADEFGRVDCLVGHDKNYHGDYGYQQFTAEIDTILMGYNTFHQITTELSPGVWVYPGKTSYILTRRTNLTDTKEIKFTQLPLNQLITELKEQEGKNIWICGGADLVQQMIRQDLIDEFHLTIMPVLLGNGIPLFNQTNRSLPLNLLSISAENGVVNCVYGKRET